MDMDQYKDMEEEGFWFEMQELAGAFSEICHKYDLSDRIISAFVVGLLDEVEGDKDKTNMRAFFHYNMQNQTELDIVKDFMTDSYTPPPADEGPDLDDLLGGLGISLN